MVYNKFNMKNSIKKATIIALDESMKVLLRFLGMLPTIIIAGLIMYLLMDFVNDNIWVYWIVVILSILATFGLLVTQAWLFICAILITLSISSIDNYLLLIMLPIALTIATWVGNILLFFMLSLFWWRD